MRPALFLASGQDIVQVRGLGREDVDAIVQIAIGSGDPDPGIAGQHPQRGVVAKPAQHQHRLAVAACRTPAFAGAQAAAMLAQPHGQAQGGFSGHVESGTIGDHVGSLAKVCSWSNVIFNPRTPRPSPRHAEPPQP